MIYIDDAIMQKGEKATAGSKILENFTAPFSAAVIERLKKDRKTERVKLSEFGLGNVQQYQLPTPMLCNDVFGHVRKKAAEQGLCYIRPTYGTVSRYGLIPTAASMDQIGVVCNDPKEGFELLSEIAGKDEKDGAMFDDPKYTYEAEEKEPILEIPGTPRYSGVYEQVLKIIAYAEISGNISRYDGIKYGYRAPSCNGLNELYTKTREEFKNETKLAAIMGCMVLSQDYYEKYYEKAMKIRRLIKEKNKIGDFGYASLTPESHFAVLAGLPSLTFKRKSNGEIIQLVADVKRESVLYTAWKGMN